MIDCNVNHDELDREFSYYLPSNYLSITDDLPLLISLHGGDDTAEANLSYTGFVDLAEEKDFAVVFPQGTVAENKGSTGWFSGQCGTLDVCDNDFISFLIDSLSDDLDLNINLERVYVTGFSNGAFMAYSLACNLSEKIAAVAPVSGSMDIGTIATCQSVHPMPVIHIHGENDGSISPDGSEYHEPIEDVINFWKDFNSCEQTDISYGNDNNSDGLTWTSTSHTDCLNDVEVEWIALEGFDHYWPIYQEGSYSNSDINGSLEIWNFLSRFDTSGLIADTTSPSVSAIPNAATAKLISEGFNQPKSVPEQWAVFSTDIEEYYTDREELVQNALNKSFGGYMNYNYMVFNEEGPDEINQPVMNRLIELRYNGWEEGYTTEELRNVSSCLAGANPNGWEKDENYEQHSTCMVWKSFLLESHSANDPNYFPEDFEIELEIVQHMQHEYFHHYQRAHALDRGLDYQSAPADDPNQSVHAPWWWIEGAAMAAEFWWIRSNWSNLNFFDQYDSEAIENVISYHMSGRNSSFWWFSQRIQSPGPYTDWEGHTNHDLNDCSNWELGFEHSDGYPESGHNNDDCENDLAPFAPIHFMAHRSSWEVVLKKIPEDYYEYGFWGALELNLGLSEQEFYDEFNQIMRSSNWEEIDTWFAPNGWNIPNNSIEDTVDFENIEYYQND